MDMNAIFNKLLLRKERDIKISEAIEDIKNRQLTSEDIINTSYELKNSKFEKLVISKRDIETKKCLADLTEKIISLLGFRENLINELNHDDDKEEERVEDKDWDPIGLYKNIHKRDIASALGYAQREHVRASNQAYALKKIIRELIVSTQDDLNLSKACYNKPGLDNDAKNTFMGEMLAYQKTLTTLQLIDLGDKDEKQKTETN